MVNLNIDVPDDLHKKIKLIALEKDITLKEYVLTALDAQSKQKTG